MKADSDIADVVPISIKNKKLCKSAGYKAALAVWWCPVE
jgi:hypothetical protein